MKSSAPMFMAMTMFMFSDADERNTTGTRETARMRVHQ